MTLIAGYSVTHPRLGATDMLRFGTEKPTDALRQSLSETIAWVSKHAVLRDPRNSTRNAMLDPNLKSIDSVDEIRDSLVSLSYKRRQLLRESGIPVKAFTGQAAPGRLMVIYPEYNLTDGAAEPETQGFLDMLNMPPWDTWVGLYTGKVPDIEEDVTGLIAWVPPQMVELVDRGIRVNPEECIQWLDKVDPALAKTLSG